MIAGMFSCFTFKSEKKIAARTKTPIKAARDEKVKRAAHVELATMMSCKMLNKYNSLSAVEITSQMFRSRGIPSLDKSADELVSLFRAALRMKTVAEGVTRKFISIIEPVVATTIIAANSTSADAAKNEYEDKIEFIEPMSITTHTTSVTAGNKLQGR